MIELLYLAIIAFFISLYLIFSVIFNILLPSKTNLDQALDVYEQAWEKNFGKHEKKKANGLLSKLLDLTKRIGFRSFIGDKLDRSGVEVDTGRFILFHLTIVVSVGLMTMIFKGGIFAVLVMIAIAAFAPLLVLDFLKTKRERLFNEQLPETLLLISGSLRAGFSFMQSVDTIVQEMRPPMSEEFKKVLSEARLGQPVEKALEKVASRFESMTFKWVVMAVKIQREIGGNLAEVLDILAMAVQERDQVDRQVRVLTAEGRLSALILFCLPFFLGALLFILNPGYISLLFTNMAGLLVVGISLALMGVGALWLRKIVRIEV